MFTLCVVHHTQNMKKASKGAVIEKNSTKLHTKIQTLEGKNKAFKKYGIEFIKKMNDGYI